MPEILTYEFMQNALFAGIFASIICGIIGPFIVAKRMVFISDGLSHTAFGGLGIAYWLGLNPLVGAVAFVLLAAVAIGSLEENKIYRNDLLIGIIWAVGMAIGIGFIYMTPGYAPDLMTFLFGNILMVSRSSIYFSFLLIFIVVVCTAVFYKGFIAITLDEEFARARGLPVRLLNTGLLVLIALSIVTLIQVVGIVLLIALLTIPVAIAHEVSSDFRMIMLISVLAGIIMCMGGLFASYTVEFPSGASIVLIGGSLLGAVKGLKALSVRH
jgi:zinc transport system permease protein